MTDDCPTCNTPHTQPDATTPTPGGGVLTDYTCRTCHYQWVTGWWDTN